MRAYLKSIKSHSGYESCERCSLYGEHYGGHVCLIGTDAALQTDHNFQSRQYPGHHLKDSNPVLEDQMQYPMVTGFVLDYMHLCTIGVMKRFMKRLISSGKREEKCHISYSQRISMSRDLDDISRLSLIHI